MDEEYSIPSPEKPSMLPLILGGVGIVFGILGLIFGMSAKSKLSEIEQKIAVIASSGSESKQLKTALEAMELRIKGVGNANDNLAMQVDETQKNLKNLFEQSQKAFQKISEELTRINQGRGTAPSRTSSTATTSSGTPGSRTSSSDAAAPAPASDGTYTIQPGDTLSSVASRFGISLTDLMNANADVDPRRLRVGQKIQLP